jgi:hypothetical protein
MNTSVLVFLRRPVGLLLDPFPTLIAIKPFTVGLLLYLVVVYIVENALIGRFSVLIYLIMSDVGLIRHDLGAPHEAFAASGTSSVRHGCGS